MNDCTIPPSTAPRLGREIRIKIGRQLRAMYADLVRQGVPARFIDLLDRL
ncbi:MAG TPA: NepR family anti-sigma factor, partial [Xanthobacteraceae bacterium]|nr:NepR family anti-sigma factor [Xanthobacteraceae bacterium]